MLDKLHLFIPFASEHIQLLGAAGSGEGEEEGGTISGEEGCDVPLICEGDAIQCAMVRQQKMHRCADEEFRKVTDKKIQDTKGIVDAAFAGEEYQPLKVTQDGTFDMSSMIDTSRHFSSACGEQRVLRRHQGAAHVR